MAGHMLLCISHKEHASKMTQTRRRNENKLGQPFCPTIRPAFRARRTETPILRLGHMLGNLVVCLRLLSHQPPKLLLAHVVFRL